MPFLPVPQLAEFLEEGLTQFSRCREDFELGRM